jgi:hypothetical protein
LSAGSRTPSRQRDHAAALFRIKTQCMKKV